MGILEMARKDALNYLTDLNGWAVSITFNPPGGSSITLSGLHTKHHLGINGETGQKVNTKQASVTVAEQDFVNAGYVMRDASGEVSMRDHQVAVKDSTGVICNYVVREWFPDESLGIIVFILGDFTPS
jgi:hypothetical protein